MNTSFSTGSYSSFTDELGLPLQVQFRHMRESRAILHTVHQMAEKLEKFQLEGAHCEVVIDEAHHRSRTGIFEVTARLTVPGERLYVARSSEQDVTRDELHAAVADVFESLERQLAKSHDRRVWRKEQQAVECAA